MPPRLRRPALVLSLAAVMALTGPTPAYAETPAPPATRPYPSNGPAGPGGDGESSVRIGIGNDASRTAEEILRELKAGATLRSLGYGELPRVPRTAEEVAEFRRTTASTYGVEASDAAATTDAPAIRDLYDPVTQEECLADFRRGGRSGLPEGWVKNHYAWCAVKVVVIAHYYKVGPFTIPVPIGTSSMLLTFLGNGRADGRRVDYTAQGSKIDMSGFPGDPRFGLDLDCVSTYAAVVGDVCEDSSSASALTPLATWAAAPARFTADAPATAGAEHERIVKAVFSFGMWAKAGSSSAQLKDGPRSTVRFDTTDYIARPEPEPDAHDAPTRAAGRRDGPEQRPELVDGAVFDNTVPHLVYRLGGKEAAVAEHIRTALEDPAATVPARTDPPKRIPGGSADSPLHRLVRKKNPQRVRDNRKAVRAECAKLIKPGVPRPECDEFPFASSLEGAGLPAYRPVAPYGDFSVKYVPGADNSSAGGALGAWYQRDRILDGDPFFIRIAP
ncbi:NucA/NucB deoxyribonuclease domain-containing protein [Streptomyces roseolus]|uniref:NucA/NucB deoxyribonuclease domain-containing protein n=1 Tax=Streptomyces roseolus TaxID=67358 RepID=UPI003631DA17